MSVQAEYALCEYYKAEAQALVAGRPEASNPRFRFFPAGCEGCKLARWPSEGGCLEYIAPAWLIANLVKEGAYLVSPGWLMDWRRHTSGWGADATARAGFASEFMRSVCLLDTLCVPGTEQNLADMSAALGVPALRIPVGLEHFATHFSGTAPANGGPVRGKPEPGELERARPDADYALALDLLSTLASSLSEADLMQELFRIFSMLFAPATLYAYLFSGAAGNGAAGNGAAGNGAAGNGAAGNGAEPTAIQYAAALARPCDEQELRQYRELARIHAPAEAGSCLVVPLDFRGERLALLAMDGFAVPEHREAYRNLLETIMPICSVALSNARKAQELQGKTELLQAKQTELLSMIKLKDRIFSIIGHDLKGPVGGIAGALEYLAADLAADLGPDNRMLLTETRRAADSVLALLGNLLEWGKSSEGMLDLQPAELDLERVLDDIFTLLRVQAEAKGLSLLSRCQPGFYLYADAKTISIALRNLISNAIKFTPRGGTVTVYTRTYGGVKTVAVADTGLGMTAETVAKFIGSARVVSTKGTEGESGTGLGLLLCQDYIERNGGKLRIDSRPGSGTIMSMDFPV